LVIGFYKFSRKISITQVLDRDVEVVLFVGTADLNSRHKAEALRQRWAGENIEHHFVDVNKMVELGSGSQRRIEDLTLTRYACYLIAQNGDPTQKPEIAFAQTCFAVQQGPHQAQTGLYSTVLNLGFEGAS
jgi:hypothetical protein